MTQSVVPVVLGSCLCGGVAYASEAAPRITVACHCGMCRKLTGSAFGAWVLVPKEAFRFTRGEELVHRFVSSEHAQRLSCSRCGSTLASLTERRPDFVHLAAGTVDDGLPFQIALHAHVASKASWFEIVDGLPQHEAEPQPRG